MTESCTPLEVTEVLLLRDYDAAVRCLELIRTQLPSILPVGAKYEIRLIVLCHHHSNNCYPAFGVFGGYTWAEFEDAETRINAWAAGRGIAWLVNESQHIIAPTWVELRALQKRNDPGPRITLDHKTVPLLVTFPRRRPLRR